MSIVVFLGILVAVNYLATRQNKRWDFTANQVYSLSDQTVKLLQSLKDPVKFTVFDQQINFDRFKDRMNEFTYHSKNVSVEYVDADREPTRAKAAGIQSYGTIVLDYQGRTERVTSTNEQDLTNALVKAVTGTTRKVYFTQRARREGHVGLRSGRLQRHLAGLDRRQLRRRAPRPGAAARRPR